MANNTKQRRGARPQGSQPPHYPIPSNDERAMEMPLAKRFKRAVQLQGSMQESKQCSHHPIPINNESDEHTEFFVNKSLVQFTETSNNETVKKWISTHVVQQKIKKIGIAVESDGHELADVISLYVHEACLIYKVAGIPVCDHMVNLLKTDDYTFGGKEGVRRLLKSKLLNDQEGQLILKTRETLPKLLQVGAASKYMEEAKELRKMFQDLYAPMSWRATNFTSVQMIMSCLDAQVGWVLTPCSAFDAKVIMQKKTEEV